MQYKVRLDAELKFLIRCAQTSGGRRAQNIMQLFTGLESSLKSRMSESWTSLNKGI
jgi:hypothetical protein